MTWKGGGGHKKKEREKKKRRSQSVDSVFGCVTAGTSGVGRWEWRQRIDCWFMWSDFTVTGTSWGRDKKHLTQFLVWSCDHWDIVEGS